MGGLAAHLERDKVLNQLQQRFFRPQMHKDINQFTKHCSICQMCKGTYENVGVYLPLVILESI